MENPHYNCIKAMIKRAKNDALTSFAEYELARP